jgi:putative oxidoreductase
MLDRLDPAHGALVLRVSLGVMALAHALLKIFVFTIPGTVEYFASIGLPSVLAYATIALELVGGIALILGVYVRPTALLFVPLMIGAGYFGHGSNGWLFAAPNGGWEYPAFLAAASLAQLFLGAGSHALSLGARRASAA